MDGPPMKLMVNPDAKPVARHSPVPVHLHWRDAVKEGLDRDVRLGVIEPVPIGEPVTWCHRMVICAKNDGTPRRTVDFLPLNAHAFTFSPGPFCYPWQEKYCIGCLERLPQRSHLPGRQTPYNIHYPLEQIPL